MKSKVLTNPYDELGDFLPDGAPDPGRDWVKAAQPEPVPEIEPELVQVPEEVTIEVPEAVQELLPVEILDEVTVSRISSPRRAEPVVGGALLARIGA